MTDSLSMILQQNRQNLSQLQNRLLTSPLDSVPSNIYKELMMTYLCLSKINEAKFLWENLPNNMKADKEFQFIASLVSLLNLKQYGDFYRLCQTVLENSATNELSSHIKQFVQQLISRVTIQNLELIELAYKSLSFEDLEKLFGLSKPMIQQISNERGWQIDSGGAYVLPKRNDTVSAPSNSNLAKLVELVCFLER